MWHTNPPLEPTRDYHPPSQLVKNLAQIKRVIKFPQNAGAEQYRYLCTVWLSVGFHSHELNPDNGWSEIQQDRWDNLLKHPVCDSSRCLNFKSFAPSPCLSFACLSVYGICSLFYFSCLQFSCLQFSKCRKYMQQKMCHTTHICFKVFSRHIIALCEEENAAKLIIHWKSSASQSRLHFLIFRLEECLVMRRNSN